MSDGRLYRRVECETGTRTFCLQVIDGVFELLLSERVESRAEGHE